MKSCTDLDNNEALQTFDQLLGIMAELRKKCPWDQRQTMESLRHLTIEEAFELSEAVLEGDMEGVKKELGDLLLHIVFYARIASEKHAFTITEVLQALCKKLIHRHPHIYGQEEAKDIKTVQKNWEQLKLKEKGNQSVLAGVPRSLPSLIKAMRVLEKARMAGLDWQERETSWQKVQEELQTLTQAVDQDSPTPPQQEKVQETFGDLLFALVSYANFIAVNPAEALERANKKFIQKFQRVEQQLAEQDKQLNQLSPKELLNYWEHAKQQPTSCPPLCKYS